MKLCNRTDCVIGERLSHLSVQVNENERELMIKHKMVQMPQDFISIVAAAKRFFIVHLVLF